MRFRTAHHEASDLKVSGQARVDAIVAAARASVAPPLARTIYRAPIIASLKASSSVLDLRLQEELEFTRRIIDAFGEQLANDPILLTRYQSGLQSLDLATQILGHLARILGSENKIQAAEQTPMESLKARLLRGDEPMTPGQGVPDLQRSASNPFAHC